MNSQGAKSSFRRLAPQILLAIVVAFAVEAKSQDWEPTPTKDRPLLELDLRKFGYERYHNSHGIWPTFVDFTDNRLVLAWLTPDDRTAAAKTGVLTPTPAHVHVLVLDAATGQKKCLQDWATPSVAVRVSGAGDGRFLTCTGNLLRLFSPDFALLQERDLQSDRACLNPSLWEVRGVSPSRQSLLLSYPSGKSKRTSIFRIDGLSAVADWTEGSTTSDISDHWLVGNCGGESREVCIRGIGQSWKPFQPAVLSSAMPNRTQLRFVNDETLVVGTRNTIAVVTVGANLVFQTQLAAKNESFGTLATSSGGERFAVMENRQRGLRSEPLDMYPFAANDRIVVVSIPAHRAIFAVKVEGTSPWTPWNGHLNQFSLSSGGTLLAVVCDDTLRVYRVPTLSAP
jgi:hypothetical protein